MQREEHMKLEAKTFSLEVNIYQKHRGAWGKRCVLRLNGVPRRLDFIQLPWIMLPKMMLKHQEICKVKCSHTVKCHSSGYQCPWAEALGRTNLSVLFICKNNVVSVYYKGNCFLWRSWGATAASERGIFGTKRRAECLCWVSIHNVTPFCYCFSFFGGHKIWMSLYAEGKITSLAQKDAKCQVITCISLRHHDTQQSKVELFSTLVMYLELFLGFLKYLRWTFMKKYNCQTHL